MLNVLLTALLLTVPAQADDPLPQGALPNTLMMILDYSCSMALTEPPPVEVTNVVDPSCSMGWDGQSIQVGGTPVVVNGVVLDSIQVGLFEDEQSLGVVLDSIHVGFAPDSPPSVVLDSIQVGLVFADIELCLTMSPVGPPQPYVEGARVLDWIDLVLFDDPVMGIVLDSVQVGFAPGVPPAN